MVIIIKLTTMDGIMLYQPFTLLTITPVATERIKEINSGQ
jgi:hypothetical protein